ncbi:MAG TPA: adenine phosphoribosyltransferase [Mycobacteriales bacterium]|nr:adenine phosphoribosyltransferase [Mycobacteriales bacterium]
MSGAVTPPVESGALARLVAARVRDVPDFPRSGVVFRDLMPLFADPVGFRAVVDGVVHRHGAAGFDIVAGVEARGFLLAAAVAYAAGVGVVPIRKKGKLPGRTLAASYTLEYGDAVVEVHEDSFERGQRVLLVDDVLATGGTIAAAADLVARAGGTISGISVIIALSFLAGRKLVGRDVHTVLTL